ncbi:RNA polymerase sigma-70 factor [Rugosimonospora africana]|nr:RNA polymerase sigma-70 factor [Rugosimonospora africana]
MTRATDTEADDFMQLRPLLFSLAYRMTGSVADSEDILSEAYLRLRRAQQRCTPIDSLRTYLSAVVTRLSIDHLRSARIRRESYFGTWLPEPLVDATESEFNRVELADSLSMAFLVLLETLTPAERAAFLLHDVFEYDYPGIAVIVDKTESNCRQLVTRARRQIATRRPRFDAAKQQRDELARRFFAAVESGDMKPLIQMLSADVVAYGDGGGRGPSLPRPINGRDKVVRLLTAISEAIRQFDLHLEHAHVNGQPGALMKDEQGRLLNVFELDIFDGTVQVVRSVVNPDKLQHLAPLIGPDHPLRRGGPRVLPNRARTDPISRNPED